jgi:hypothetical protein
MLAARGAHTSTTALFWGPPEMQLIYGVDAALRAAGFRTARAPNARELITFEDDTVLGMVAVYASAEALVEQWRAEQDAFLRENAAMLRRDPAKAWNAYAIFLTAAPAERTASQLLEIESDVVATRKIARAGILTEADVLAALAPVLPLRLAGGHTAAGVEASMANNLEADERRLFDLVREHEGDARRVVTWLVDSVQ